MRWSCLFTINSIYRGHITQWCAQCNNYNHKPSIRLCTDEQHPIPCPHGQAMRCLSWVIQRKITTIYQEHTVMGIPIALWQYLYIESAPWLDTLGLEWVMSPPPWHLILTHWGRDNMAISQKTLSSTFSWMKVIEFWLIFHWNLFLRVQLAISQHWFR